MRVRGILRVRNDAMISAREERGWSQGDLAAKAGVSMATVQMLEWLRYRNQYGKPPERERFENDAISVAIALEIPVDDVFNEALYESEIPKQFVSIVDIPEEKLLKGAQLYLGLPDPNDVMRDVEGKSKFMQWLDESLCAREKLILLMRYGFLGGRCCSYGEIGRKIGVSKCRVSQIERHALQKLGKRAFFDENPSDIGEFLRDMAKRQDWTPPVRDIVSK